MAYMVDLKKLGCALLLMLSLLFASISWAQNSPDNAVQPAESTQSQPVQTPEIAATDSGILLDTKLKLYQYIDRYADRELGFIKAVVSVLGLISFVFLGVLGYFAKRYIDDIQKTVQQTTTIFLDESFAKEGERQKAFTKLADDSHQYVEEYKEILESLEGLRELKDLAGATEDASYAYSRATLLVKRYMELDADAQGGEKAKGLRLEVSSLLDIIESEALKGNVNANTVFNAAANAGRMQDTLRSLRLMTLAADLEPSDAHQLAKLDEEYKMGISFSVSGGSISRIESDAGTIRETAFARAMEIVAKGKLQQSEIIISRAWNMAERGREEGALDALIEVLEGLVSPRKGNVTSYVHVTLAQLYGRQALPDWEGKAKAALTTAIELLAKESPLATWYDSSQRELGTISQRLGLFDFAKDLAEAQGIELSPSEGGDMAELMALMAASQQQDLDDET